MRKIIGGMSFRNKMILKTEDAMSISTVDKNGIYNSKAYFRYNKKENKRDTLYKRNRLDNLIKILSLIVLSQIFDMIFGSLIGVILLILKS